MLSVSAALSAVLIYTNIINTADTQPVRISDILDGAVEIAGEEPDSAAPAFTLGREELTETMFSRELMRFTSAADATDEDILHGEGAVLLMDTTLDTPPPETPTETELSGSEGTAQPTVPQREFTENDPFAFDEFADDLISIEAAPGESAFLTLGETSAAPAETAAATTTTVTTTITQTTVTTTTPRTTVTTTTPRTTVTTTTPRTTVTTTTPRTTVTTTRPQTTVTTTTAQTTTTTTTSQTTATTTAPQTTVTTTTPKTTAKTTTPETTETHKTPFINVGGGVFSNDSDVYLTLFRLVNEARKKEGLSELWYSARVHEVCELRTSELTSYYSHTRPDGSRFSSAFRELGITYTRCGENIAYGKNMFTTAEEVFNAWMDSPSHRENILSPEYECVAFGLSILTVGMDTYYYWAQEFAAL